MAIPAHFDEFDTASGKSRQARRTLRLDAEGMTDKGAVAAVRIHNISTTGLLLETQESLAVDDRIAVDLPQIGATAARVIWQSGELYGCQFDKAIVRSALSAAELRSAAGAEVPLPAQPERGDVFAGRLQRLRKASGLSLSQIAEELGVSKPTVWAWEQGKAHPVEGRIAALAQALGVSTSELVSGTEDPAVRDLIASCRHRIAETFGISAEKVRIIIDL